MQQQIFTRHATLLVPHHATALPFLFLPPIPPPSPHLSSSLTTPSHASPASAPLPSHSLLFYSIFFHACLACTLKVFPFSPIFLYYSFRCFPITVVLFNSSFIFLPALTYFLAFPSPFFFLPPLLSSPPFHFLILLFLSASCLSILLPLPFLSCDPFYSSISHLSLDFSFYYDCIFSSSPLFIFLPALFRPFLFSFLTFLSFQLLFSSVLHPPFLFFLMFTVSEAAQGQIHKDNCNDNENKAARRCSQQK